MLHINFHTKENREAVADLHRLPENFYGIAAFQGVVVIPILARKGVQFVAGTHGKAVQ